ncbi:hypothetical protein C3E87_12255 [Tessaracoccus sp. ZS01]|nr:hypothetical protein [Tessaracoccus sp. ZS01]OMG52799.1 hypothetical protein BJN44_12305 [Tessaracoccus sp. ZS01]
MVSSTTSTGTGSALAGSSDVAASGAEEDAGVSSAVTWTVVGLSAATSLRVTEPSASAIAAGDSGWVLSVSAWAPRTPISGSTRMNADQVERSLHVRFRHE